jgi:hypothetical protein
MEANRLPTGAIPGWPIAAIAGTLNAANTQDLLKKDMVLSPGVSETSCAGHSTQQRKLVRRKKRNPAVHRTRNLSAGNHHCGGGVYGTTAGGAAPYVTGAVAHGSQGGAGGGQGGGHGAGCGRHQLQQPQPAVATVTVASASRSDILFIASVSLPGTSFEYCTATGDR